MAPKPSPDDGLASEQFPYVNGLFYSNKPHEHFRHRLHLLMLGSARHEDLNRLHAEGVAVGKFKSGAYEVTDEHLTSQENQDHVRDFTILEAEVLLHQAAETLLRMYLAHRGALPCPWLEIARLRRFWEFKKNIDKRFRTGEAADPDHVRETAQIMCGSPDRTNLTPEPPEAVWNEWLTNIERYLGYFAEVLLDRAGSYNAAKHGFTAKAGTPAMSYTIVGEDAPVLSADGSGIVYLDTVEQPDGSKRWAFVTKWFDVGQALAFVWCACQLIEQMWLVGRARYTGEFPDDGIRLVALPPFEKVVVVEEGVIISTLAIPLDYYASSVDEPTEPEA